jgi:flavodoxin
MKTAVVFYSLDGNCAFTAEEIKTQLNADLIRLETKDEKKRGKVGKMLWGCAMVFSKKKPPIKPYSFDSSKYDLIILGAPVWAGSPAPPIRTFISETNLSGKKIALFVCHGGGRGKSLKTFQTLLTGNNIAATADFKEPAKNSEDSKKQIADWVKGFKD